MDRRSFLVTSLAGAFAAPLVAEGQQGTVRRVGWLSLFSTSDPQAQRSVDIFRQALRDLGHVEGQSVAIEYRWAEAKSERLLDLATELVRLKVAVIVAHGGVPAAQAVARSAGGRRGIGSAPHTRGGVLTPRSIGPFWEWRENAPGQSSFHWT